jgi:hypothetical protein
MFHVILSPVFQGEESGFTASGSRTDPSGDGTALRMTKLQVTGIGGQRLFAVLSRYEGFMSF